MGKALSGELSCPCDRSCSYFSSNQYVVPPHLNCLVETVQMRGHNICFYAELTKIVLNYHQIYSFLSRALKHLKLVRLILCLIIFSLLKSATNQYLFFKFESLTHVQS